MNTTEKRYALIAVILASFLTPFMGSSINLAIPVIGSEFHANAIMLSWIPTAYLLTSAMLLLPFGRGADIYGRKRIFTGGVLFYTISSLLCGVASSIKILLAFRVLQGIGGAMIMGTGVAILTSVFPLRKRGKVLGINTAAIYSGLSLGPFLGGFFTQHFGWRSIFFFSVPLGIAIILFSLWGLKGEWAEAKGERFDLPGAGIYSLSLITIMYGISSIKSSRSYIWMILVGAVVLILFILWERKIPHPLLNLKLFSQNITFAFSNVAALFNYSATYAIPFLLSLYLQLIRGFPPQSAGLILLCQPVMQTIFSPFAGALSDRVEPRIVVSLGMGIILSGLLVFSALEESSVLWLIILNLMLVGFGFALFSSPNTNAVMSSAEKKYYGVASSTLGTMRLTGQMFSMAIVILIFAVLMGEGSITPSHYPLLIKSSRCAFALFGMLCFLGMFVSLARGKIRGREKLKR
ncbi:MAG: MFS transporter [Candidatus Aerophobetes bacterium]|nr:MFS transporter [Candidatus Aerophobetes bacterium]